MSSSLVQRVARRFAKPFLRPIDGRIGDVNRRVGSMRASIDELGRKVSAQTTTVTESNSYLGVELRSFGQELQGLHSDITEHEQRLFDRVASIEARSYGERLELAARLPVEKLDSATANLINHAISHRGFLAEAGLWFNPPLTVELREGSARLGSVNERIVELPFAFGALARLAPPAMVLDIGGAESTFALSAASLGYSVTALDLREIPYRHPNLQSIVGRFEDWDHGAQRYDAIFLISTVEHIGLGAYGEPADIEGADRRALDRARDLLADDGVLVLTTPFGRRRVDSLERTYDEAALEELLAGWTVLDQRLVRRLDGQTWSPAGPEENERIGVAMVVATPQDAQLPGEITRQAYPEPPPEGLRGT